MQDWQIRKRLQDQLDESVTQEEFQELVRTVERIERKFERFLKENGKEAVK